MKRQRYLVFPMVMVLAGVLVIACGSNTAIESQPTPHLEDNVERHSKQRDDVLDAQIRQSIEENLAFLTPAPKPTVASPPASAPAFVPLAGSTPAPGNATLTVGNSDVAPGNEVTFPILLDTGGKAVRSVQVNLAYDGAKLTNPVGVKNPESLASWGFTSHSPRPGDLRLLAVNWTGNSETIDGPIFTVSLTVDASVQFGDVPISVAQEDVRDESSLAVDVSVTDGAVTVTQ